MVPEEEKESCCSLRKPLDKLPCESLPSFPSFSPFFSTIASVSWLYLTSMLSLSSQICRLCFSFCQVKEKEITENVVLGMVWAVSVLVPKLHLSTNHSQIPNVCSNTLSPDRTVLSPLNKLPCPMIMDFSAKLSGNSMPPFPRYIDIVLIDDLQIIIAMDAHSLFQLITVILLPPHLRNLMNKLDCLWK